MHNPIKYKPPATPAEFIKTMSVALMRVGSGKTVFYKDFSAFYAVKSITIKRGYYTVELENGRKFGSIALSDLRFYTTSLN